MKQDQANSSKNWLGSNLNKVLPINLRVEQSKEAGICQTMSLRQQAV